MNYYRIETENDVVIVGKHVSIEAMREEVRDRHSPAYGFAAVPAFTVKRIRAAEAAALRQSAVDWSL